MDTAIILPPDYRPSADEEYMNETQQEYFRQKLVSWKKSESNKSITAFI
jgi:DnaK suppressor protein